MVHLVVRDTERDTQDPDQDQAHVRVLDQGQGHQDVLLREEIEGPLFLREEKRERVPLPLTNETETGGEIEEEETTVLHRLAVHRREYPPLRLLRIRVLLDLQRRLLLLVLPLLLLRERTQMGTRRRLRRDVVGVLLYIAIINAVRNEGKPTS